MATPQQVLGQRLLLAAQRRKRREGDADAFVVEATAGPLKPLYGVPVEIQAPVAEAMLHSGP